MYIQKRSHRQPHLFVLLAFLLLIGALIPLSIWGYTLLSMSNTGSNTATNFSTSSQDTAAAQNTAQRYMQAFFAHHYDTMWSLLHPQLQMLWPNQQAFANYWNTRFQEYNLHTFRMSKRSRSYNYRVP